MNILFITPSYKPAYIYGGPIVVISMLAEELVKLGHNVTVLTTSANGANELKVPFEKPSNIDGVQVIYFRRITKDHTHIAPSLWRYLHKHAKSYDIVHIHSWWNVLVIVAAWICKRQGIQPVLSPHGMFSDYILSTNNSLTKEIMQRLIGKKLLRNTHLHVSTAMEWEESQQIVLGWEGSVIPNLVTLPDKRYKKQTNEVFTIGFLSRIDPKKGMDILIKALSKVHFPFRLLVAGAGKDKYVGSLKQLAKDCGIADNIQWVGWKNGEAKFQFLSQLDLFALISHSENFAIVVIESLATGTPVLISKEVGLHEYVSENKFGWVTNLHTDEVTRQLDTIYKERLTTIKAINERAPTAIQQDYDPAYLAQQYLAFYK